MTQIWMLRNSDTDVHVFNRFEHLLPSVKISYSACTNVQIEEKIKTYEVIYRVTGKRMKNGELGEEFSHFDEQVIFKRLPVWTEPCHL